jgi:hypothetical protein
LFFGIILLPILSNKWMEDWKSWLIQMLFISWSMFASKFVYKIGEKYWYSYSWVFSTIAQGVCLLLAGFLFDSWIFIAIIYFFFSIFDGFIWPSWNHILVQLTRNNTIATTRSIIFWIFALYLTIWKQILSFIPVNYAFIVLGVIILLTNLLFARKMLNLELE